ncbi:MAG: thioesterase [Paludibacteraceae bacterium]|nr:thioesterase [Paludibacteraceae bacterium]
MEAIGEHFFTVQPFEVDFRGRLTFPLLINNLLNAAGHHSNDRGFGIKQLNENKKTWVLSRIAIELTRHPINAEKVKVQTWIEGLLRSFTLRNFTIIGEDNKIIGYARTIWAMIDSESRKPINLTGMGLEQYVTAKDCPIDKAGKIVDPATGTTETFRVKYSDVDINQHLNSAKYVEHIIDAFTLHKFSKREIKRFEIEYIEECMFGETITLQKTELSKTEFIIILKKEDGSIACKSRLLFTEQTFNDKYITD